VAALDVLSALVASAEPDNLSNEPVGYPSKDELAEGDSVVFAYSIVPPRGRKSDYHYVLRNMKNSLEDSVKYGGFHYWLQQAALDDVYPDLLMGQITLESCTIIEPTYGDDDDVEPEKSGLALPAVISIAVGAAAFLIGAVLSLYCCFCKSPAGEWVPALTLFCCLICPHMHSPADAQGPLTCRRHYHRSKPTAAQLPLPTKPRTCTGISTAALALGSPVSAAGRSRSPRGQWRPPHPLLRSRTTATC
jgi:hypothetical protein